MARETAAQRQERERQERERQEREANYLASRVPATIADVREFQIGFRHELRDLADRRERLIEKLRYLARNLTQEADRLVEHPDWEASETLMSSSTVLDITRESAQLNTRTRLLKTFVGSLTRQGVDLALEAK